MAQKNFENQRAKGSQENNLFPVTVEEARMILESIFHSQKVQLSSFKIQGYRSVDFIHRHN